MSKFFLVQNRILVLIFILAGSYSSNAQVATLTRYFDSSWKPVPKESAFYYTEFVKKGDAYETTSYWTASHKVKTRASFYDTTFSKPAGLLLSYYENGQVEDSAYYYEDGTIKNTYHFYTNGKLWAHYSYDKKKKTEVSEGYDENGKAIPNFVYMKEAEFPGGEEAWKAFLSSSLNPNVPIKNKAPKGTYNVIIRFVIDKNGKTTDIEAETSFGYGMEEEAIRIIKRSPRWMPLMLLGKKENAYRRQPITFQVMDK